MKKEIYLIYETDSWHAYANRNLLIATDTKEKAVNFAMSYLHKNMCLSDYCELKEQNLNQLNQNLQTQGCGMSGAEIEIDWVTLDKWQ